jgi:hypothetical protein
MNTDITSGSIADRHGLGQLQAHELEQFCCICGESAEYLVTRVTTDLSWMMCRPCMERRGIQRGADLYRLEEIRALPSKGKTI